MRRKGQGSEGLTGQRVTSPLPSKLLASLSGEVWLDVEEGPRRPRSQRAGPHASCLQVSSGGPAAEEGGADPAGRSRAAVGALWARVATGPGSRLGCRPACPRRARPSRLPVAVANPGSLQARARPPACWSARRRRRRQLRARAERAVTPPGAHSSLSARLSAPSGSPTCPRAGLAAGPHGAAGRSLQRRPRRGPRQLHLGERRARLSGGTPARQVRTSGQSRPPSAAAASVAPTRVSGQGRLPERRVPRTLSRTSLPLTAPRGLPVSRHAAWGRGAPQLTPWAPSRPPPAPPPGRPGRARPVGLPVSRRVALGRSVLLGGHRGP